MDDLSKQESLNVQSDTLSRSPNKSKRFVLVIFIFLIIAAGVFGGNQFFQSGDKEEKIEITPSPSEKVIDFLIEEPKLVEETPIVEPTTEPTDSPIPKPTVNPVDKETGLDRSELSIEVQNGSGVTGAASKAGEELKKVGYNVLAAKNADNSDYEDVLIKIKSAKAKFLDLLKKDLGFSYTVGSSSADLSDDLSADAVVIIGK